MLVATVADRGQQTERLEQMRNEFLAAQQRRRNQSLLAADRPADTDRDPRVADERSDASVTDGIVDVGRNSLQ